MMNRGPLNEKIDGHNSDGLCPCCNSGLDRIKRDLVEVSDLVANSLSAAVADRLGILLADVRVSGRLMFAQLSQSLAICAVPSYPIEFEQGVRRFGQAIDELTSEGGMRTISEEGVFQIYMLRFALDRLAKHVRELVDELNTSPPDRTDAERNGPPEHSPAVC